MTRDQKHRLAMAVLSEVGNLIEYWDEKVESGAYADLKDIDPKEAAKQISAWLWKLPTGDGWDIRLPDPTIDT
jgi:hypothetical protein